MKQMKLLLRMVIPLLMLSTGQQAIGQNVLTSKWEGPYGGLPAFDKVTIPLLSEAVKQNIEEGKMAYEKIASNPEPPSFENTILAMEKVNLENQEQMVYYGVWGGNMSSPEFRKLQQELSPLLSAYNTGIIQNEKLFTRIKSVYEASLKKPLGEAEQMLVKQYYEDFIIAGAQLNPTDKAKYADIQKQLSSLHNQYSNNVLADEEKYFTFFSKSEAEGLSESFLANASVTAKSQGKEGMYAVSNTRSSMDPFLTFSSNRPLREKVWKAYYSRGNNGDANDNKEVIQKILQLRHERSVLLGKKNYAEWRLQDKMAKVPDKVFDLLTKIWPLSVAKVHEEVAEMQKLADKDGIKIEPWDYRYYAEKVRKAKFDLNSEEVKAYLQLDKLTEAMFYVAGELFNYKFTALPVGKVPVFHEDVRVWEVSDKTTGKIVGLWYLDPYARPGKRSGAWASAYRSHTSIDGNETLVLSSNNSNFVEPAPGEALLIGWDDANTFFHEFGHALHNLASNVKYPGQNRVVRDYVEFHSQLLERWLTTDEVISRFFRHHETGKPMPAELVAKIKKAATFNQGFETSEYLASALMDMYYHTTPPDQITDVAAFEKETLEKLGMPSEIVMRHRSTHFTHAFAGEGYSAGYYSYIWADVLTSDASDLFRNAPDGFYNKALAEKMVKYLFAPRGSIDPGAAYELFSGRKPGIDALINDRGLGKENRP